MTKPVLLMIHGYACTGRAWTHMALAFRAMGYRVETPTIRPTERTHADPPSSLAGLSLADYVDDMERLARGLADETGQAPVVFGHSMGGLIAQKLGERGAASGLVLMAPGSAADARGRPALSPVITFLNCALTPKPETKALKLWRWGNDWGVLNCVPKARRAGLYSQMVYDSGRVLSDMAYPDRDPDRTAHVDETRVQVPVLTCAGARDRTIVIGDMRLTGAKYARIGGDFVEYADNAHWLVDEPGTDDIIADVGAWLSARGL